SRRQHVRVRLVEEGAETREVSGRAPQAACRHRRSLVDAGRLVHDRLGEGMREVAARRRVALAPGRLLEAERTKDTFLDVALDREPREACDHLAEEDIAEVRVVPRAAGDHELDLAE